MTKTKAKYKSDFQNFTILHNEFIETDILSGNEKLVFMAIKRYIDSENKTAFPSLTTISKSSRLSKSTVHRTLKILEDKGIIKIEHRQIDKKGTTSNLYTVYDYKSMWSVNSSKEVKQAIIKEQEQEAIKLLKSKGYTITKKRELVSGSDQTTDTSTQLNNYSINDNTAQTIESQELERYTLEEIHQLFDYNIMLIDNPFKQRNIDSVMDILYTAMNTTKKTIRIAGENKPTMVVIGKLMKLDKDSILYTIKKFSEQTERIKNPMSYMLTMLYNAPEQFNLDIQNQALHDMAHWNPPNEYYKDIENSLNNFK